MKPQTIFHLLLRPEPRGVDAFGRDPLYRLRGALKVLLRRFGLRCVGWGPDPPAREIDKEIRP